MIIQIFTTKNYIAIMYILKDLARDYWERGGMDGTTTHAVCSQLHSPSQICALEPISSVLARKSTLITTKPFLAMSIGCARASSIDDNRKSV